MSGEGYASKRNLIQNDKIKNICEECKKIKGVVLDLKKGLEKISDRHSYSWNILLEYYSRNAEEMTIKSGAVLEEALTKYRKKMKGNKYSTGDVLLQFNSCKECFLESDVMDMIRHCLGLRK